jgi:hypothetical protein
MDRNQLTASGSTAPPMHAPPAARRMRRRARVDVESGLVRQCAWCKRVHDGGRKWRAEHEVIIRPDDDVTHSICPRCFESALRRSSRMRH